MPPSDIFPPQYTFPPFFTLQPNATTASHQRQIWSAFILRWCQSKKIWRLNVKEALETELFWNRGIERRLKLPDVITLLDSMAKDGSLEWEKVPGASGAGGYIPSSIMNTVSGVTGGGGGGGGAGGGGGPGSAGGSGIPAGRTTAYVWWRKPEEWANVIYDWIDTTGQKNAVLTLYEISAGDLTVSQEFYGMDPYQVRKSLDVLCRRGLAQIFSINDEFGVKFF